MDDEVERKVPLTEGKEMAEKYGMPFSETSAKEGTNVNQVFEELGRAIITDFNKMAN